MRNLFEIEQFKEITTSSSYKYRVVYYGNRFYAQKRVFLFFWVNCWGQCGVPCSYDSMEQAIDDIKNHKEYSLQKKLICHEE